MKLKWYRDPAAEGERFGAWFYGDPTDAMDPIAAAAPTWSVTTRSSASPSSYTVIVRGRFCGKAGNVRDGRTLANQSLQEK